MIVENTGYLKMQDVLELKHFSIYETHKNTQVLIKNTSEDSIDIFYAKEDRLPYKTVEGKKICRCQKVFDSKTQLLSDIDISKWNNSNQIMSYKEFGT